MPGDGGQSRPPPLGEASSPLCKDGGQGSLQPPQVPDRCLHPHPASFPEEGQKQKELAKAEVQKVLKEKALLTADLSSMEKSFSDLFRRFEKQKEAIEGYHKVRCPC